MPIALAADAHVVALHQLGRVGHEHLDVVGRHERQPVVGVVGQEDADERDEQRRRPRSGSGWRRWRRRGGCLIRAGSRGGPWRPAAASGRRGRGRAAGPGRGSRAPSGAAAPRAWTAPPAASLPPEAPPRGGGGGDGGRGGCGACAPSPLPSPRRRRSSPSSRRRWWSRTASTCEPSRCAGSVCEYLSKRDVASAAKYVNVCRPSTTPRWRRLWTRSSTRTPVGSAARANARSCFTTGAAAASAGSPAFAARPSRVSAGRAASASGPALCARRRSCGAAAPASRRIGVPCSASVRRFDSAGWASASSAGRRRADSSSLALRCAVTLATAAPWRRKPLTDPRCCRQLRDHLVRRADQRAQPGAVGAQDPEHAARLLQRRVGAANRGVEVVAARGEPGAELVEQDREALARRRAERRVDQVDVDRRVRVRQRHGRAPRRRPRAAARPAACPACTG